MLRAPVRDKRYLETELGPYIREYLAWKRFGAAESTLETYEYDLARLCARLPQLSMSEIGAADLLLVMETVTPKQWRRVKAAWNDFFRWGIRFGKLETNPVDMLPTIKPEPPRVYDIFSEGEQQSLLNAASSLPLPDVHRARVETLLHGARKGEARKLQLKDFDLFNRATVFRGKGNKERAVPIRGELVSAIDRLLLSDIGPIFPLSRGEAAKRGVKHESIHRPLGPTDYLWFPIKTQSGRVIWCDPTRPMSERGFHEWWGRLVETAGVRYRKPHMTRHTFATDTLDATEGDLYAVKELLGHSSTRVTEVYIHSSKRRMQDAIEKLQAYRRKQADQ